MLSINVIIWNLCFGFLMVLLLANFYHENPSRGKFSFASLGKQKKIKLL